MGLCGFGFGGYKEKIDPKIVLVSLFQGRLNIHFLSFEHTLLRIISTHDIVST